MTSEHEELNNLEEIRKRFNNLNVNLQKICGYLADYHIDKAIETQDFAFIWNTIYDYFVDKDPGYLLTKFDEYELKDKVEDVEFSLEEWFKVQEDLKKEYDKIRKELPDTNIRNKDEYINDLIIKRKFGND